ncbi:MAG: hypothetical protein K8S98_08575 [Planctomycetes bacterium]|nr:hypothetical protein [Planctomycetota bacterium]
MDVLAKWIAAASACVVLALAVRADELDFRADRHGFGVRAPSARWAWYIEDGPPYSVTFFPSGSQGVPSWTLELSPAGGATDATLALGPARERLVALGAKEFETSTARLADRDAPTLRTTFTLESGVEVELRATFLIERDELFTIQEVRAPNDDVAAKELAALRASFTLFAPVASAEPAIDATWTRLAARCGEELGWASSWEDAAERATRERKVVLVLVENYAALNLPATAKSGPFVDPDFAALVAAHCVPWAMGAEDDAPFRAPERYGISEHAWGTAYLFVEPDGDVLAETEFSNAPFLDRFFRTVVLPKLATKEDGAQSPALERAERALARGELERALELVKTERSSRALRVRAAVARREGDSAKALELLRDARKNAPKELEPELVADEAGVQLLAANYEEARANYERVVRGWPDHPRAEEALFQLGALRVLEGDDELEPAQWKELVAKHPESRWAFKAAANLARIGSFVSGGERPDRPEPELVAQSLPLALAPLVPKELVRARDDALAWLLANQRADGSWWVPSDGFGVGANLYTTATTAIAATSLIEHAKDPRVRAAIDKALAHVLATVESGELASGADLTSVYSIWNRAFAAWLCAHALERELGDRARLKTALDTLVAAIEKSQHRGGGYPYVFFPGDPEGKGFDPSASFLTAGVAIVFADARRAGAKVSEPKLARALDFLESLRDDDGTFRYMRDVAVTREDGVAREACGRGPVCALALRRNGRSDKDEVKRTLDLFVAHRDVFRPEWRKVLCHTSPTGFGAHYLMYDYAFAAVALEELTPSERKRYRAALLEDVLAERQADGSFEDLPGLGRAWGTAAALLMFDALAKP